MDFYARLTSKTISQFPTLVAAHQAEVRGPPVGRGPQVENRCSTLILYFRLPYCQSNAILINNHSTIRTVNVNPTIRSHDRLYLHEVNLHCLKRGGSFKIYCCYYCVEYR